MTRQCGYHAIIAISFAWVGADGAEFVPISAYQHPNDRQFSEFGIDGALVIEDFEDGSVNTPGLTMMNDERLTAGQSFIGEGFSVAADSLVEGHRGLALEAKPTVCATTYPSVCPATVSFGFDDQAFGMLPTYVGLVWTDAWRGSDKDVHPWARVNVVGADGDGSVTLVNELPVRESLRDAHADDTLISFINYDGIRRLDFTVITSAGGSEEGHLAIDHLQYGLASLAGDADVDGDVDFADFSVLSHSFGSAASWRTGDFNFDGRADFVDFLLLSDNFGQAIRIGNVAQSVPEPGAGYMALFIGMTFWILRSRPVNDRSKCHDVVAQRGRLPWDARFCFFWTAGTSDAHNT